MDSKIDPKPLLVLFEEKPAESTVDFFCAGTATSAETKTNGYGDTDMEPDQD